MRPVAVAAGACLVLMIAALSARSAAPEGPASWNRPAAAAYLDARAAWWVHWPTAARDHETACVSCHTTLPYALARPALRGALGEAAPSAAEQAVLDNVGRRVAMWRDVEPFYPDQTRGLPKSSESRGTEAVLNAAVLAARDAARGTLGDDARAAFANMWALQFKAGDLKGGWAWLNFHLEPWESTDASYFGAALAAISVGSAPGGYASLAEIQPGLTLLREYLAARLEAQPLFNRGMALWASGALPGVLDAPQREAIAAAIAAAERPDGGWSMADLGAWHRIDSTELDRNSDGYATALMVLALERSASPAGAAPAARGVGWLAHHQDSATGGWTTVSVNKQRDPASDAGKFMSDAATAYAVLALLPEHRAESR
jgi:squalene-hopene/tetraprenyl-beta-curcumene cyclase